MWKGKVQPNSVIFWSWIENSGQWDQVTVKVLSEICFSEMIGSERGWISHGGWCILVWEEEA